MFDLCIGSIFISNYYLEVINRFASLFFLINLFLKTNSIFKQILQF